MYCPSCGTESSDQTKYCTRCGVNLRRVKGALAKDAGGKDVTDSERTALDEIRISRRAQKKKSPEEKRLDEIKGGVITSSIGFGLMVFLYFLFDAVASTVDGPESNILRSLWAVGLIPFMIGAGIIFNGLFISKKIVELKREQERKDQQLPLFSAPNTSQVSLLVEPQQNPISDFSITEPTTTKLREPASSSSPRDTN